MNEPNDKQNFLIEITPSLHNRLCRELGDAYIDNHVLHYSPYWLMEDDDWNGEKQNAT